MTTVNQAAAHLHTASANASPHRIVVTAGLVRGGDPEFPGKRFYSVQLATSFKDQLYLVTPLWAWFDTRSEAVQYAKTAAVTEGLYYAPGLWNGYVSSSRELTRLA